MNFQHSSRYYSGIYFFVRVYDDERAATAYRQSETLSNDGRIYKFGKIIVVERRHEIDAPRSEKRRLRYAARAAVAVKEQLNSAFV